MKRKICLLLVAALLLGLLPVTALAAPTKARRDTQSALQYGGHITLMNDMLYYMSDGNMNSMKPDGSGAKKLFALHGTAGGLMPYGGEIYYWDDNASGEERNLFRFAPGAKKPTVVIKNISAYFVNKGIVYYTARSAESPMNQLFSLNLKTGKKTTLYESRYGGIFGVYHIQDMLVIYDQAIVEGDDAVVLINPETGKSKAYVSRMGSVNAYGDSLYFLDNEGNLLEYSFNSKTPSMKKLRTVRKNVYNYMISGDYFYIEEADADYSHKTIYKRNIKTDQESVYIKKTERTTYLSGIDATLEPMGDYVWRFSSIHDVPKLETKLKK